MEQAYITPEITQPTFITYDGSQSCIVITYIRPSDGKKYRLKTPIDAFRQVNMLLKSNLQYSIFYRDGQPCGINLKHGYCYYCASESKLDSESVDKILSAPLVEHFVAFNQDERLKIDLQTALKFLTTVSMHPHDIRNFASSPELQRRYKVYFGDTLTYRVIEALAQDIACGLLCKEVAPAGLRKSALMNLFRAEALDEYIGSLPL
mgnify:FL=1